MAPNIYFRVSLCIIGTHYYSPTVIVAAITSRTEKNPLPTHIQLCSQQYGLRQNSLVLLEQVRTIDRSRLREYIGHLSEPQMQQVNEALAISFGLDALLPEPQISLSL